MRHIITITGIIAIICILFTSSNISDKKDTDKASYYNDTKNSASSEPAAVTDTKNNDAAYTLKEYQSKLAVFYGNSSVPLYVTNVLVSELPKADRSALKNGITAGSRRELDRLIEDYCS